MGSNIYYSNAGIFFKASTYTYFCMWEFPYPQPPVPETKSCTFSLPSPCSISTCLCNHGLLTWKTLFLPFLIETLKLQLSFHDPGARWNRSLTLREISPSKETITATSNDDGTMAEECVKCSGTRVAEYKEENAFWAKGQSAARNERADMTEFFRKLWVVGYD